MVGGEALLYIGIAPDKASKPNSRQSLLHRIRYHYRGNAEGSTLRRILGVLLEEKSGFPLRRVGSGERITLTHAGERTLTSGWDGTRLSRGWRAPSRERVLLGSFSCPLNLKDNNHHSFAPH